MYRKTLVSSVLLIVAILVTGCSTPNWQRELTSDECDSVVHELNGFGKTRQDALNDAAHTAAINEFGAYVSSELVLVGSELTVNSYGQFSSGMVDSAVATEEPQWLAAEEQFKLHARVTLCRNTVLQSYLSAPEDVAVYGPMAMRTQTMLDISDSQQQAHAQRSKNFKINVSNLLNPVTGPSLHRTEVTSFKETGVISPGYYGSSQNEPPFNHYDNKRVSFDISARVFIAPEVKSTLEQLLQDVALNYHTPGLFGRGYKRLLGLQGFAFIDQRVEQITNPDLDSSDRHATLQKSVNPIADIVVMKGLIETRADDAKVLHKQVTAAIDSFTDRGLIVAGWSEDGRLIMEVPLLSGRSMGGVQVEKIALYPESSNDRLQRSNGAVFQLPSEADQKWIADQISPLRLVKNYRAVHATPAMRRGGTRLNIQITASRELSTQLHRFTIEQRRPLKVAGVSK